MHFTGPSTQLDGNFLNSRRFIYAQRRILYLLGIWRPGAEGRKKAVRGWRGRRQEAPPARRSR